MSRQSQFRLLGERRFGPFFLTQLGGAFNDNLLKQVLVQLVTFHAADYSSLTPGLITNMAAGIFILPFALFSALAGQLADRYDKAVLIRIVKASEVIIMGIAAAGFYAHSLFALLLALFLMGTHSTFFGPAKYSLLPRVLAESELVGGNGLLEMGTFASILAGTLCASVLVAHTTDPMLLTAALTLVAVFGLTCSLFIPPNGCAAPDLAIGANLIRQTADIVRRARHVRVVWFGLLGISWFWFFGVAFLSQLPVLVLHELHSGEEVLTLMLAVFAIGVASGSLLCERLSGGHVEWGLVPFGSIGMTLFAADLGAVAGRFAEVSEPRGLSVFLACPGSLRLLADIALLGAFGGIFSVPLYATVQARSQPEEQSRVIAANNVLNALFMVAAAGMGVALTALGAGAAQIVGICAVLNALVAAALCALLPQFVWRFCVWILGHTLCRARASGLEHVPARGAALLAPQRLTLPGAMALAAVISRPMRFAWDESNKPSAPARWLLRTAGAGESPRAPRLAAPDGWGTEDIRTALAAGQIVCLWPAGACAEQARGGALARALAGILERTPAPLVAVAIQEFRQGDRAILNPFARRFEFRASAASAADL